MLKLFNHYVPSTTIHQLVFDALLLFVAVVVAFVLQVRLDGALVASVVPSAFFFALTMMILNGALGLYRPGDGRDFRQTLARVGMSIALSVPVAYGIFQVLPWGEFAHEALELNVIALLGFVVAVRGFTMRRTGAGVFVKRIMVIGTGADAAAVEHALAHSENSSLQVVGFLPSGSCDEVRVDPKQIIRFDGSLLAAANHLRVNEIIVAVKERRGGAIPLRELLDGGLHVEMTSGLRDVTPERMTVRPLGRHPVVYLEPARRYGWRAVAKRIFDLALSSVALVCTAPVLLIAAMAIKLSSPGPVLFRQVRAGRDGKPFYVLKLRTMVVDAEARLAELMEHNESDGPLFKMREDPRITTVGRFLRKLSIDELPQLWNVVRGDMSLVGPRPALQTEVEEWGDELHERLRVRPGITGMWQVSGRSDAGFAEYQRLDLFYVDNWSILIDLGILLRTVPAVVTGRGAS